MSDTDIHLITYMVDDWIWMVLLGVSCSRLIRCSRHGWEKYPQTAEDLGVAEQFNPKTL